mgnify:CR=1 FL=1
MESDQTILKESPQISRTISNPFNVPWTLAYDSEGKLMKPNQIGIRSYKLNPQMKRYASMALRRVTADRNHNDLQRSKDTIEIINKLLAGQYDAKSKQWVDNSKRAQSLLDLRKRFKKVVDLVPESDSEEAEQDSDIEAGAVSDEDKMKVNPLPDFNCNQTEFASDDEYSKFSEIANTNTGKYANVCNGSPDVKIIAGVKYNWTYSEAAKTNAWVKEGGSDEASDKEKGYKIKGKTITLNSWSDLEAVLEDNNQAYQDSTLIIVKSSKGSYTFKNKGSVPKGSPMKFTRAGLYDWNTKKIAIDGSKGAWVRRTGTGSRKKKTYGTSERWRPSGRGQDRRAQYKQFYKDLQKAGLLKLLFKKGKVRTTGRGSVANLNESDGLDFAWGGLHTKAYKELLKVVQASGAKSIDDWRAGKTSATGETAEAGQYLSSAQMQTVEAELEKAKNPDYPGRKVKEMKTIPGKITNYIWMEVLKLKLINKKNYGDQEKAAIADYNAIIEKTKAKLAGGEGAPSKTTNKELERLNVQRKFTFDRFGGKYTPLTADQLADEKFNKLILRQGKFRGVTQAELDQLVQGQKAKTAAAMKGKRADQLKRKQAALMLAREVREVFKAIEGAGTDEETLERIIGQYARSEEFEGTGVKRNLNLLATRYQKFSGRSLIDDLIDDGEQKLANIVRYGDRANLSGDPSQGILRGRGTDVIDPDLDDDAAALIKAARGAGTDEETIKRVIIKNKNKLVKLAQAYRRLAADQGITDEHANLVTMLYDEADSDEERAFARNVQRAIRDSAAQIDTSLREGKTPMSKINLKKLKALFKEELKKKLEEQSTTGGMTLPSGQDIGAMSIDPADLEQMLDVPHPETPEAPAVSQQATKTSSGLVYTPERKAFIRYIKGLHKRGKLSKAQEKKLRRALFSRKYTPKDMAGKEITKLINSQVVAKMNHDQMTAKPLAGIEGALSGKKASVSDLKASLKRLQSGPQNDRTKRSIARVQRMIARAEQRGPDVNVMQIAKTALDNLGKSKTADEMEASLKKMKSSKNASSPQMQRAIARGERMLARKRREESPSRQVAGDSP